MVAFSGVAPENSHHGTARYCFTPVVGIGGYLIDIVQFGATVPPPESSARGDAHTSLPFRVVKGRGCAERTWSCRIQDAVPGESAVGPSLTQQETTR